jgi:hypothetical protein
MPPLLWASSRTGEGRESTASAMRAALRATVAALGSGMGAASTPMRFSQPSCPDM